MQALRNELRSAAPDINLKLLFEFAGLLNSACHGLHILVSGISGKVCQAVTQGRASKTFIQ